MPMLSKQRHHQQTHTDGQYFHLDCSIWRQYRSTYVQHSSRATDHNEGQIEVLHILRWLVDKVAFNLDDEFRQFHSPVCCRHNELEGYSRE